MARKKRSDGCTEQANHNKTRPWPDLPVPVVISIRKQLHLLKHVYFGGVCKKWRAATRKCIKSRSFPELELSTQQCDSTGNLLSFPWCKWYQPKGSKNPFEYCIGSSYGRLIMRDIEPVRELESWRLTVLDPFWGERCVYTLWDSRFTFKHIILSAPPQSLNCRPVILTGSSNSSFLVYRNGTWNEGFCNIIDPNTPSGPHYLQLTNAIAFEGKIYALSLQGTLAQLNPDSVPRISILRV
ncbi:hypothetical protein ACOSP7_029987 [Xanthoceras sorbifolium]